ncbi:MAG: right-handed parallel beta-helix repeat-containing protein [Verrucomicrobiota bacterium]
MDRPRHRLRFLLAALTTAGLFTLFTQPPTTHAATGGPDNYGYTWDDAIGFQWIDITTTGQLVISGGSATSSNDAVDGIGAPVTLGFPFTLYGQTVTQLVPTTEGYLSTDPAEAGLDEDNDCPLPTLPSKGTGKRIYAYHANLNFVQAQSNVYYQYFDKSPHSHYSGGVSIFTWDNAAIGTSPIFVIDVQALLFDNGDIIINYDTGGLPFTNNATIGLQDTLAANGLAARCNPAGGITGQDAILFTPPITVVTSTAPGAIQTAINTTPAGGRITFGAFQVEHDYSATININKPLNITGPLTPTPPTGSVQQTFDSKQIEWDISDTVVFDHTRFTEVDDTPITLQNGAVLKLNSSEIFGAGDHGITADDNTRIDLLFSRIECPQPGSSHLLDLRDDSTLNINCSILTDSRTDAIFMNASGAAPATPNVTIRTSCIVNNRGSALVARSINALFENTTLSNNQQTAIELDNSTLATSFCTIVENHGGIELDNSGGTMNHTILAENFDPAVGATDNLSLTAGATATSLGYNLTDDATSSVFVNTGDLVNTDPLLTPLTIFGPNASFPMFCHLPLANSPVIEAGAFGVGNTPATDQRLLPRFGNGDNSGIALLDIGAIEHGTFAIVTTNIDENNGTGAGFGASLREVGAIATGNQVIRFDNSLNGTTIDLSLGGQITAIGAAVFVDASTLANGITISGNNSYSASSLFGAPAAHGLTFTGAENSAINNTFSGRNAAYTDCHFISNDVSVGNGAPIYDTWGGAIKNAGTLLVNQCTFTGNRAQFSIPGDGGAIANIGINSLPATLIAIECHFESNQAGRLGGAISSNVAGSAPNRCYIDRCTFANNSASSGGAVYLSTQGFCDDTISRSTFHDNQASDVLSGGGALIAQGSVLVGGVGGTLVNTGGVDISYSTFHRNFANNVSGDGGALRLSGGPHSIDHCTITQNQCEEGGAISLLANAVLTIQNTIVDNNYGTFNGILTPQELAIEPGSTFTSLGRNLSGSIVPEFTHATDINGAIPLLGPLLPNGGPTPSRRPLATSPAIDAGSSTGCPTDQRGIAGKTGSATDIGAVEVAPALVVNTIADEFNTPSGSNLSLREAIRDVPDGGRIVFDENALAGFTTIDLSNAALGQGTQLTISKNLTIDATTLSKGITIDGPGAARCLNITNGDHTVVLHGISFTGGNASLRGGAIRKGAGSNLTMTEGAIHNNFATQDGGGIRAEAGNLTLQNVTLSTNDTDATGGAISATTDAVIDLSHCTVVDNKSASGAAGIDLDSNSDLTIKYTVLGQNLLDPSTILANYTAEAGATTTSLGKNITDDAGQPWFVGNDLAANLLISSFGDLGGLAKVHPPLALSPIVNAGNPNAIIGTRIDARGQPRIYGGSLDIGAMEMGDDGVDSDNDGITDEWEVFYGLNENDPNDANLDLDGDGQTALQEHLAHTIPNSNKSALTSRALASTFNPGTGALTSLQLDWDSVPGVTYNIWHSTDAGLSDPWEIEATVPAKFNGTITDTTLNDPTILSNRNGFFEIRPAP